MSTAAVKSNLSQQSHPGSPSAENGTPLAESDVRAIVRLLGGIAGQTTDPVTRRRALMNGLCDLIEATRWAWGLGFRLSPDSPPTWILQLHGGFDDVRVAHFLQGQVHPDMTRLTAPFSALLRERKTHLTRLRQQTDPTDSFRHSDAYRLWALADAAPGILSCRPLDADTVSTVSLHRSIDAPFFTERESRIAHIVLSEIAWLHANPASESSAPELLPQLSPRQQTVFNLLALGKDRDQIANLLGISRHTVNGYVKTVFRHFGVQSQVELIRRFTVGNGGDV